MYLTDSGNYSIIISSDYQYVVKKRFSLNKKHIKVLIRKNISKTRELKYIKVYIVRDINIYLYILITT